MNRTNIGVMESLPMYIVTHTELDDLLNKEPDHTVCMFNFPRKAFTGFWVDDEHETIHYYVGGMEFCCDSTPESVDKCVELCN